MYGPGASGEGNRQGKRKQVFFRCDDNTVKMRARISSVGVDDWPREAR